MLASVTHIRPLVHIRRTRTLPAVGEVLVSLNQRVIATDVVAQTSLHDTHVVLDLNRLLGAKTPEQIAACLERKVGERLQAGDVIAQSHGMFARIVRAPAECWVASIRGTLVALEIAGSVVELQAGMPGTIVDIIPDKGVIIEVRGSLIQGVWGNGVADQGSLMCALSAPDEELTHKHLDVDMRGTVVLGGHVTQADVLQVAESLPLRGLILASLTADLIPAALKVKFPIFAMEGFGRLSLNSAAYKLLTSLENHEIAVNAALPSPISGERPELVIPVEGEADELQDKLEFRVGAVVRLHGGIHSGELGRISLLRDVPVVLENRLRAICAVVDLEGGDKAVMPLSNLDVIA